MSGKVVLVTGGTGGVGPGIAAAFLQRNAQVVVCGRNAPPHDAEAPVFLPCDVRDPDRVAELVAEIRTRFGRLDVAVNNAGGSPPAPTATASPRFNAAIIDLNLIAPMHVAQQANAVMQEQAEGGCIINIASVNALRPSPETAAYGAAKAGLLNLTASLAVEWAPKVRVNAVTAGIVGTEEIFRLHYGDDKTRIAELQAAVPMGRMATPEDIGNACVFLASPLASHVSGATLLVHGGGEPPDSSRSSPSPAR